MHNWSTDTQKFKDSKQKKIWKLEQTINWGLKKNDKKLKRGELVKYLPELNIDPDKRKFIEYVISNSNEPTKQRTTYKRAN